MAASFEALLGETKRFLAGLGAPATSFVASLDWRMRARRLAPATLPAVAQVPRCVELATNATQPLVQRLAHDAADLHWGQTYTAADFGEAFIRNYGWVELFGARGHFANETVACGFLLLGPGITYPDHHHIAEELYVPLTGGTEWRKGDSAFVSRAAGTLIHHPSNMSHAMRTGTEPLLALYLWRGGPLTQNSVIGR